MKDDSNGPPDDPVPADTMEGSKSALELTTAGYERLLAYRSELEGQAQTVETVKMIELVEALLTIKKPWLQ